MPRVSRKSYSSTSEDASHSRGLFLLLDPFNSTHVLFRRNHSSSCNAFSSLLYITVVYGEFSFASQLFSSTFSLFYSATVVTKMTSSAASVANPCPLLHFQLSSLRKSCSVRCSSPNLLLGFPEQERRVYGDNDSAPR
ncbi:hypothetical protein Bca4012_063365 [Brassica carinata]